MPKQLSPQEVFETAHLLSQMKQDQIDAMIVDLRAEQPAVYDYFDAMHRVFPDEQEWNDVVGIGYTIWQILKRTGVPPGRITEEMIIRASEDLERQMSHMVPGSAEAARKVGTQMALSCPEPAMLLHLSYALKQVGAGWSGETFVRAFRMLRILLDAFLAGRRQQGRRGKVPARRLPPMGRA